MNRKITRTISSFIFFLFTLLSLISCSSGSEKKVPSFLEKDPELVVANLIWSNRINAVDFPLQISSSDNAVTLVDSSGNAIQINTENGIGNWKFKLNTPISAGLGGNGIEFAAVSKSNKLIVFHKDKIIWQRPLPADSYTPPLVAGGRVFVLTANREVVAFDGKTGAYLWKQERPGDSLVLKQSGVLLAVGNTLVVGLGGSLVGLNPDTGLTNWDVKVANSRGINDVERLVDLIGPVSRNKNIVCVRAYQTAVACVDAFRGRLLWSKSSVGEVGITGDEEVIFSVESDGKLTALKQGNGERLWYVDSLKYRDLSSPILLGRSVAVGDGFGFFHLLSRKDGSLMGRLKSDNSAIINSPVLVGKTLVLSTAKGGIFGYRPQ